MDAVHQAHFEFSAATIAPEQIRFAILIEIPGSDIFPVEIQDFEIGAIVSPNRIATCSAEERVVATIAVDDVVAAASARYSAHKVDRCSITIRVDSSVTRIGKIYETLVANHNIIPVATEQPIALVPAQNHIGPIATVYCI